jgi:hypothetical protein
MKRGKWSDYGWHVFKIARACKQDLLLNLFEEHTQDMGSSDLITLSS